MITIEQFYMGRNRLYAAELTAALQANAADTVRRVNAMLDEAALDGVTMEVNPKTNSQVSSGWRPAAINAGTPGAAVKSKHMLCLALDVYDPEGELDEWALANPEILAKHGLYQEHPSATKGWAHFQTVAPRSGNRVFYP